MDVSFASLNALLIRDRHAPSFILTRHNDGRTRLAIARETSTSPRQTKLTAEPSERGWVGGRGVGSICEHLGDFSKRISLFRMLVLG